MTATYWACAQTHPRQEELALRNLRRQGFTSFFPFFMIRKLKHGIANGTYLAKPAFPGYVFIQFPEEFYGWGPINNTLGISRLMTHQVPDDEYRTPCRAGFVDDLWQMRILQADRAPDVIPIGTMIKIKRGPFAERVALVSLSTTQRVGVMLEMFNRSVVLEFDVANVERIMRPVA